MAILNVMPQILGNLKCLISTYMSCILLLHDSLETQNLGHYIWDWYPVLLSRITLD